MIALPHDAAGCPRAAARPTAIVSLSDRARLRHLLLLPVLLYAAVVLAFAVNVPVGDDHVVLGTVIELGAASGWSDRLGLLLAPHNEHRIVATRALAYALSRLPDGIDLRGLIFVGNAALLGALLVLGRLLRLDRQWPAAVIVILVMLQPQPYKLMFYPMAIIGAYGGLLFSLAYFYATLKEQRGYLAALFYVCAVLTTGAGLFLIVPGALALVLRRRRRALAVQLAVVAAVAAWYFHGLETARTDSVGYALHHPLVVGRLFLGVLGGIAEVPAFRLGWVSAWTSVAAGVVLLAYALSVAWRILRRGTRADDVELAMLLCLVYGLMTVALVALNRAALYEDSILAASLDGRYRIYGLLVAALCLVDALRQLEARQALTGRLLNAVLVAALVFNLGWYAYRLDTVRSAALSRTHALQLWLRSGDTSELPSWALPPEEAGKLLHRAVAAGVFRPH